MNIAVLSSDSKVIVRTDNTLVRDSADFYVPDFAEAIRISPVVFVRISSPCRCCSPKFAARHMDMAGFGALVHCCEDTAESACIDRTTYISGPLFPYREIGGKNLVMMGKSYEAPSAEDIAEAFSKINARVYLRTADLICLELDKGFIPEPRSHVEGSIDSQEAFSFDLK